MDIGSQSFFQNCTKRTVLLKYLKIWEGFIYIQIGLPTFICDHIVHSISHVRPYCTYDCIAHSALHTWPYCT